MLLFALFVTVHILCPTLCFCFYLYRFNCFDNPMMMLYSFILHQVQQKVEAIAYTHLVILFINTKPFWNCSLRYFLNVPLNVITKLLYKHVYHIRMYLLYAHRRYIYKHSDKVIFS